MTTLAEEAEKATFDERYRAAVEDNVRLVAEKDELRADLTNATRVIADLRGHVDAQDRLLDAALKKLPTADQVVILRADYERLLKALPATSPGLKVIKNEEPTDG